MAFTDLINLDDAELMVREFKHYDERLASQPNEPDRFVRLRLRALDGFMTDRMGTVAADNVRRYVTGDEEYVATTGQNVRRGRGPVPLPGLGNETPPERTVWAAAELWTMQYPESKDDWYTIEWFILLAKKLPDTWFAARRFANALNRDFETSIAKKSGGEEVETQEPSSPEQESTPELLTGEQDSTIQDSNSTAGSLSRPAVISAA